MLTNIRRSDTHIHTNNHTNENGRTLHTPTHTHKQAKKKRIYNNKKPQLNNPDRFK